ncbi:MAG: prepilin-type N-terminal cleavage/methylation domain-containing protein [Gemmatimonadales bacterium]|nr:prepilin-type N-terminal cleavage/methylation domain-containing protein [Gemmatimonadales bacterium]MBT4438318.1 prepilin-type N-terminal cleavage/methylation domain-containing protein [Gemmatimonadales bacterium]MBT6375409.1 prepilin-type N-terminal cleavage/methylation domain-containing protein [Gemmatimonadales bacterium]
MNPKRAGFSMVELIMVMLLMGILAGIAAPSLRPEKFQLDAAAVLVASSINAQQLAAVLRQHNVVLAFDTVENRLRVHYDEDNDNTIDTAENWYVIELDDNVRFSLGGATARPLGSTPISVTGAQDSIPALTFRRNGSASEESIIYITSMKSINESSGKDTRSIEIERATGRTRCYSFSSGAWVQTC